MANIDLTKYKGNILGGSRAEVDKKMLKSAFVETADFQALITTKDFNFVVGRRGTGKSALFGKISEHIRNNKMGYVYCKKPTEYTSLDLYEVLKNISASYDTTRAITRVAWRVSILLQLLKDIKKHYKFKTNGILANEAVCRISETNQNSKPVVYSSYAIFIALRHFQAHT